MLTTRFAPAVLVLLALAAVPTVIHSYLDSAAPDGRTTSAIPARLADENGTPTKRRASWGEDRLASSDWFERSYARSPEVKLAVARSFDAKKVYHHPELAIDYGPSYERATTIRLPQRPDVPVYVLRGGQSNSRRLALYTLHYDDGYVEDPIRFQLRASFTALFSNRKPMTIFFAAQDLPPGGDVETSKAARLLLAAMEAFEKQAR
jgi:hypothetical protein